MENAEEFARLPNGERVVIETVELNTATVRRIEGERAGTHAVCDLSKLAPETANDQSS